MPYVNRNEDGFIVCEFNRAQHENQEFITLDNLELAEFRNPPETWEVKRQKSMADGGYGTVLEQLELLGEKGVAAFRAHAAAVKARFPKV